MDKLLGQVCNGIFLSGILLSSLGSTKLYADVPADAAPQISMKITSGTKLSLGEPVILHAEIANPSAEQKLWVRTGLYETEWYTLSLIDANGNSVATLPDTRTREPRGAQGPDFKIIGPSGTSSIDIVATRFLPILHPGNYLLKVHVQTPYVETEAASEDVSQVQGQLKSAENVLVRDVTYRLIVTAANSTILQSRANALEQNILTQTVGKSHDTDLDALFSMPEEAASPIWQQLADKGNPDTQARVADHLANLHSTKAADILFKMVDNKPSSEFASEKLAAIYNDGSPALREHIKSVAAQKGVQLPEKVDLPQVHD